MVSPRHVTNTNHSSEDAIRVVSYNIQCIPGFLVPHTNFSVRRNVIPSFIKKLVEKYNVDIMILQEMFDLELFYEVKKSLLQLLPYTTGISGHKPEFSEWDTALNNSTMPFHIFNGGVCIFSKFKILEKHQLVFTNSRNTCSFARKGAILAVMERKGKFMNVVGTHLQAFAGRSSQVRQKQYLEILNWLEDLCSQRIPSSHQLLVSKDYPFIMAGDFNTCCLNHKSDFEYMFSQSDLKDYVKFQHTLNDDNKVPTYSTRTNDFCKMQNTEDFSFLYDYILTGPGVTVVHPQTVLHDKLKTPITVKKFYFYCLGLTEINVYNASDHFPVLSVISL